MKTYAEFAKRASESVEYWSELAMLEFVGELTLRMERLGMKKSDLAARIGTSPAYVTKVIHGDANFTLETMTKLAMAVGARVRVRILEIELAASDHRPHQSVADKIAPRRSRVNASRARAR